MKNSDQKRSFTRRSQRSQRTDRSPIEGAPIQIGLRDLCDLCVKKSDQKRSFTRRSQRSQRTDRSPIEEAPIPIEPLRPLRSLCEKIRSEKIIHTEITKIAKNRPITDRKAPNSNRAFATFAISVWIKSDQKRSFTRRSQRSQKQTDHRSKRHQFKSGLCDLFDLCVDNSVQKKRSTGGSQSRCDAFYPVPEEVKRDALRT